MGEGRATILTDPVEKTDALTMLMKTQTGRNFYITEAMTDTVAVLRIDVEAFTAKARQI